MALTKVTYSMIKGEVANVLDYGAVADATSGSTGTDNAAAFKAAIDTGKDVFIPATPTSFGYRVSSVTISKPTRIFGEGIDATVIWPTNNYSCFVVASDNVEISNLTFLGKTGTGQAEVYGDCIKFAASFSRPIEASKIERIKFRNLKMNGIHIAQTLRESHIRECRFIGMGNAATSRSGIYALQTQGTATNTNILWIDKNMFYRFDTPAIWLRQSARISSSSQPSYDGIMITDNLIHGQLQDENGVEAVQPYPTNHVTIEDGTRCMIRGNLFTAIHPKYSGVSAICGGVQCKTIDVSHNQMTLKEVVGGVTYNRAIGNATGFFVNAEGLESISISANSVYGGGFNYDFRVSKGSYSTPIDLNVTQNTTESGLILVDYTDLGTWRGAIANTTVNFTNFNIVNGTDNTYDLGSTTNRWASGYMGSLKITDGITAPATIAGYASIYVDTTDGDLKIKFGNGIVKTIVTDT